MKENKKTKPYLLATPCKAVSLYGMLNECQNIKRILDKIPKSFLPTNYVIKEASSSPGFYTNIQLEFEKVLEEVKIPGNFSNISIEPIGSLWLKFDYQNRHYSIFFEKRDENKR